MKKSVFIILIFLCSLNGFSQNFFFVDKKGEKKIIQDDSFDLVITDKRLQYVEVGKRWEKFIKFSDLDYALIGPYYFKSFKLINEKGKKERETAYFVMLEANGKKLLCYPYTIIGKYSSVDHFDIYVIDDNNNVLDYVKLNDTGIYTNARGKIAPFVKKHFSDCKPFMEEFSKYDVPSEKNLIVLQFFKKPFYLKCNN